MPKKNPQKPKVKTPEKRRPGQPSKYSHAIANAICKRLSNGESLRSICRDEAMPHIDTVREWKNVHPEFSAQYARARDEQADTFFEEMLQIAHDGRNDTQVDKKGNVIVDYDHIQRSKLRVDTLKWCMARMAPRKYGDRQAVEMSGPDGSALPIQIYIPSNGRD